MYLRYTPLDIPTLKINQLENTTFENKTDLLNFTVQFTIFHRYTKYSLHISLIQKHENGLNRLRRKEEIANIIFNFTGVFCQTERQKKNAKKKSTQSKSLTRNKKYMPPVPLCNHLTSLASTFRVRYLFLIKVLFFIQLPSLLGVRIYLFFTFMLIFTSDGPIFT